MYLASTGAFFRLLRPHQWIKNCFVFAGLLFVSPKTEIDFTNTGFGFLAFCAAASSIYIVNDVCDAEADRLHPVKCDRPIAAGQVSLREAFILQVGLFIIASLLAWDIGRRAFGLIMLYVALNIAYSFWLKRIVLLDVFAVALGFMLRIALGTVAIGIPASHWLLLTGFMLTLFLALCKRQADPSDAWGDSLLIISLEQCVTIAAAGTIVCYALFTLAPETIAYHRTDWLFTTVPFAIYGVMRYLMLVGDDAAKHLMTDPHLIAATLGWFGLTVLLCWS